VDRPLTDEGAEAPALERPEQARQPAPLPPAPRPGWLAWVVPPLVAWLGGNLFYWLSAARNGWDYLSLATHGRWDSGQYLRIARVGYVAQPCGPKFPGAHFRPTDLCGDVDWFPAYPALIRALHLVGVPYDWAGLLLTEAFTLGALAVLWWLFGARLSLVSGCVLALAALFPGSIYYHALFPMSLSVFAALLCLALLGRRLWLRSGLAGAVAAAAYPTNVLLAPAAVLGALLGHGRLRVPPGLLARIALCGAVICLGLGGVEVLQHQATGIWNAWAKGEAKYGAGIHNPIDTISALVGPVPKSQRTLARTAQAKRAQQRRQMAQRGQFILVAVLVAAAIAVVLARWSLTTTPDRAALVYGVLFWLAPLVSGVGISQYRPQSLLLPVLIPLRHLPRRLWPLVAAGAVAAGWVAWQLAPLFYDQTLI
jgi:hypothetical protein